MTFEQLLTDLRAGNVPNATQNEILLALAEAIKDLQVKADLHERAANGPQDRRRKALASKHLPILPRVEFG